MINTIRNQIERMMELNSQLLTLSRRGRMDLYPLCLNELMDELRQRFPRKPLAVQFSSTHWVQGSWAQLSRAVSNLITNAFEASRHPDDPVIVQCTAVQIRQTQRCHMGFLNEGSYAKIEVIDQGSGISDEIVEKIFEPFFSTKTHHTQSSSGLGLSIVSAVVDDHKGVLDLKTGPEGTVFTLYIPLVPAPVKAVHSQKVLQNATLCVAECNTFTLREYEETLKEAGYTIFTAQGEFDLFKILRDESIDALLLDFQILQPKALMEYANAIHCARQVRTIILADYLTEEESRELRTLGVTAILSKPVSRNDLLTAVKHALAGQPIPSQYRAPHHS